MFDDIIGNEESKKILKKIVDSDTISHSYIFAGISGIGKFKIAKNFAKSILCQNSGKKPCNKCKSCECLNNSNNPDLYIIDEQEDGIKTEQIKDLANNVLEKPILGNKKVYIINNSENMTKDAQNSLLKTLEEPPEYVTIILITCNENLLLNTIKSRCIKIQFNKLSTDEINEYLKKNSETLDSSMINVYGGSIEKVIYLKNKKNTYEETNKAFENIENMNELQILKMKDIIFKDKEEVFLILDYINTLLYDKIINNINDVSKYQKCIKAVEETKLSLKKNANYDMTIDNFLFVIERSLNSNG